MRVFDCDAIEINGCYSDAREIIGCYSDAREINGFCL